MLYQLSYFCPQIVFILKSFFCVWLFFCFFVFNLKTWKLSADEPKKRILWAAENNKLEEVQQLLAADPSLVHSTDKDGYSPLHRAAYSDHLEMAEVDHLCVCAWLCVCEWECLCV